jgi:hypothetical protein
MSETIARCRSIVSFSSASAGSCSVVLDPVNVGSSTANLGIANPAMKTLRGLRQADLDARR